MSLLVLLIPAAIITILVAIVLAIIATFHKDGKFTGVDAVLAGIHFLSLLAITLAVTQVAFIGIEKFIPDLLTDSTWSMAENRDMARIALAVLFVAGPIFLVFLYQGAKKAVDKVSWTKRFMSVTVILFSSLVVVGTLVTLIYGFLSGDLGMRMLVKSITLLAVAGGVAAYYQAFVRSGKKGVAMGSAHIFGSLSAVVMVAAMIGGFMVTGGPAAARAERFDDERLNDLSSLQWQISSYWQEEGRLPSELLDLNDSFTGYSLPADPKTKEPYGYRMVSEETELNAEGVEVKVASFEICATFETERALEDESNAYRYEAKSLDSSFLPDYYPRSQSPYWNHPEGYYCFERELRERKDQMLR